MGKSCQRKYLLPAVLAGSPGGGDSGAREGCPPLPPPLGRPSPAGWALAQRTHPRAAGLRGTGAARLDGSQSVGKDGAEPCF